MHAQNPIDVAFSFVECINRRDLTGLTALMTEDHTFIDLAGDVERGRAVMREGWAGYFSRFPEYMIHVGECWTVEDTVVLVGRTTGSHLGLPRATEFAEPVIWAARIEGKRVAEWRLYSHTPETRAQLGVSAEGVARAFVARFNARDLAGLNALVSPDHRWVRPDGTVVQGAAAARVAWVEYFATHPGQEIQVTRAVTLGATVILSGQRAAPDAPATTLWAARVENGQLAEWRTVHVANG